jgi:hypothetical protein
LKQRRTGGRYQKLATVAANISDDAGRTDASCLPHDLATASSTAKLRIDVAGP